MADTRPDALQDTTGEAAAESLLAEAEAQETAGGPLAPPQEPESCMKPEDYAKFADLLLQEMPAGVLAKQGTERHDEALKALAIQPVVRMGIGQAAEQTFKGQEPDLGVYAPYLLAGAVAWAAFSAYRTARGLAEQWAPPKEEAETAEDETEIQQGSPLDD